jgi:hypothetical protein
MCCQTRFLVRLLPLLLSCVAIGCAPNLVVRTPLPIANAQAGPVVRVLPIADLRPAPLHVSTGYVGMFQMRQDFDANKDTPPAAVLGDALAAELLRRGLANPAAGQLDLGCQLGQFLLRYRNYAGAYSATDGWGYLDLLCRVSSGGQVVWEGPVHARHHRVFYVFMQTFPDAVWPELTGALVQQVAAILNRNVFHQSAAPGLVQDAMRRLKDSDADKRYQGAYMLGMTGDPGVLPLLMPYLADPDKKVRRAVVDALGTLGAREALPTLLERFAQEDGNVQWATIKDILQLGDPAGFAWLQQQAPLIKADTLKEITTDVLEHMQDTAPARPPVGASAP